MACTKDVRDLMRKARKQGWTITVSRSGRHFEWTHPKARKFFSSRTPSDTKAVRNIEGDLLRSGAYCK